MKISELYTYAPKSKIKAGDASNSGKYQFFASSQDETRRYDDYLYDGSAIIMGTGGSATLHYCEGKFSTSTDCLVLIPNDKIRPKYLYYYFLGNMKTLEAGFHGAGLKHTSKTYIDNLEINEIPGFDKQDKIIKLLDKLSSILFDKKRQLVELDELIKARFVEMFGKEKPTVPFGDVLIDNTKNGYKFDSKFYNSRGEIAIIDQGQSLICGRMNLQKNKMPWSNEAIIFGDHTEVFKYIDFPFYLGADGTKLLTPKRGWDARFLYYYLVVNYRKRLGYMRHFKYLKEMLFIKPGIDEQLEFKIICNQVDKSKFVLQKSLEKTQLLFDSLMWEYFGQ